MFAVVKDQYGVGVRGQISKLTSDLFWLRQMIRDWGRLARLLVRESDPFSLLQLIRSLKSTPLYHIPPNVSPRPS